jgi:hypothetical protein
LVRHPLVFCPHSALSSTAFHLSLVLQLEHESGLPLRSADLSQSAKRTGDSTEGPG